MAFCVVVVELKTEIKSSCAIANELIVVTTARKIK